MSRVYNTYFFIYVYKHTISLTSLIRFAGVATVRIVSVHPVPVSDSNFYDSTPQYIIPH